MHQSPLSRYLLVLMAATIGSSPLALADVPLMTYTVTSNAESGPGTLREAIQQANAHTGFDEIVFDSSLSGAVIEFSAHPLEASTDGLHINASMLEEPVTLHGLETIFAPTDDYGLLCDGSTMKVEGLNTVGFTHGIGSSSNCAFIEVGNDQLERGLVRADGARLYGIYLKSNGRVVNTRAGELEPNERGVYIENANNASVGSTELFGRVVGANNTLNGINFFNSTNTRLVNAVVYGNQGAGVRMKTSSGTVGGDSPEETIYAYDNGMFGLSIVYSTNDLRVTNMKIGTDETGAARGNIAAGIFMDNSVYDILIENTSVDNHQGSGVSGVLIDPGSHDITLQNNVFNNNVLAMSVKSNRVSILHNEINAGGYSGIMIHDNDLSPETISIVGNTIRNADVAIQASDQNPANAISDLLIQDNTIVDAVETGISVSTGTSNVKIWGNTVDSNESAIDVRGSNIDIDASQDPAKANHITRAESCIAVSGEQTVVKGNKCTGIVLAVNGAHDNQFEENEICIQDDLMPQILVGSGTGNTFRKNRATCSFGQQNDPSRFIQRPFDTTSNGGLLEPSISSANTRQGVSGNASCAECIIDLYGQYADRRVDWLGETTSDSNGNFTLSSKNLGIYSYVIVAATDLDGNTSPSSSSMVLINNAEPVAGAITVEQTRDGTRIGRIHFQGWNDADLDVVKFKLEFSVDNGQTWRAPSLKNPSTGRLSAPGEIIEVSTSMGPNNGTVEWDLMKDLRPIENDGVLMRVTPFDLYGEGETVVSEPFEVDTLAPKKPMVTYPQITYDKRPRVSISRGEPFAHVFTEGTDSGYTVNAQGESWARLYLPTLGPKLKIVQLADEFGNLSEPVSFMITRL